MNEPPQLEVDQIPKPISPPALVSLTLVFEGGLGILAWLLSLFFGSPPLSSFRWDARDALVGAAATVPMLAVFLICLYWPIGPLARIKSISEEIIGPLFGRCSIAELALIAAAAGIGEEMLFRGFLQAALDLRYGWLWGLCGASLIFGLMHSITHRRMPCSPDLLGAIPGWILAVSVQLLVPVIAHALYDFVALVYLVMASRSRKRAESSS